MNINHSSLIGDTALIEPALSAWSKRNGECVDLYCEKHSELFRNHPTICIHYIKLDNAISLSASDAFSWATDRDMPFATGYFNQLGMDVLDSDRIYYNLFNFNPIPKENVYIATFARSCASHRGEKCNLQAPLEWWEDIIKSSPYPVKSLGSNDDPIVPDTIPCRGNDLDYVIKLLAGCKLLISVETGILHLASAAQCPTIFLSSATPVSLSKPNTRCEVVRADSPLEWKQSEVIDKMRKMLR